MPRKHKKANKQLLFIKIKKTTNKLLSRHFHEEAKKIIDFFFLDAFKAIKNEHHKKSIKNKQTTFI